MKDRAWFQLGHKNITEQQKWVNVLSFPGMRTHNESQKPAQRISMCSVVFLWWTQWTTLETGGLVYWSSEFRSLCQTLTNDFSQEGKTFCLLCSVPLWLRGKFLMKSAHCSNPTSRENILIWPKSTSRKTEHGLCKRMKDHVFPLLSLSVCISGESLIQLDVKCAVTTWVERLPHHQRLPTEGSS